MHSPLPVTLEITPPAKPLASVLLRRAATLQARTRRINVIQRADRWSSLEASIALEQRGFEAVWHLANRGRRVAEIEVALERAAAAGIRRVLCIRGEHKAEDSDDTPKIREVVRMIRRRLPDAHLSVSLNPFALPSRSRPFGRLYANLDAKIAAGAHGVQTQVCFDLEALRPVAQELKTRRPEVAITPMLMPLRTARAALRLSRRLAVPVPPALVRRLEHFGENAGWEHFEAMTREIAESPLYHGLAVMTPIDPTPTFAARLRSVLGRS